MPQYNNATITGIRGTATKLNITAQTVVKAVAGTLVRVSVTVAGSAAGTLNDCATTGAVAAANLIGVIPNTVGTYTYEWPLLAGLVVTPGTGQSVAVSYS